METQLNYENRTEKTPADAPLICCSVRENINSMDLENKRNPLDNPKFYFHVGSGNNFSRNTKGSISARVFVLGVNGKPLTPCKQSKARKLLKGKQAKPIWNKFGQFGIQMIIETNNQTPETILGIDNGTKFEGYSIVSEKENNTNVMWLLPNKKTLIKKLKERRILRRTRRFRNCRRRKARFDNRNKDGFIAPSQLQIVQSRLKAIKEFFKSYPISKVAFEDVKFNHRDKRWGKNFSTIEIGKNMIKKFITNKIGRENLILFEGTETYNIRNIKGLKKSSNKSAENFNSHCVDSFVIASELVKCNTPKKEIIIVDDTYRPTRRRLHDTNFSKGGKRDKYSTGNFKGIRKGSVCNFGQVVGGTKNTIYIRDDNNKRFGRSLKKIDWYSKHFKVKQEVAIPLTNKMGGILTPII